MSCGCRLPIDMPPAARLCTNPDQNNCLPISTQILGLRFSEVVSMRSIRSWITVPLPPSFFSSFFFLFFFWCDMCPLLTNRSGRIRDGQIDARDGPRRGDAPPVYRWGRPSPRCQRR